MSILKNTYKTYIRMLVFGSWVKSNCAWWRDLGCLQTSLNHIQDRGYVLVL